VTYAASRSILDAMRAAVLSPSPRPIHIGITGTQGGMTADQWTAIRDILRKYRATTTPALDALAYVHHGCCVGVDEEVHQICLDFKIMTILHPPEDDKRMSLHLPQSIVVQTHPRRPYLTRNHDIVDACDVLIAVPAQDDEVLRSGTWSTVRYARKRGKPILLLTPSACPSPTPCADPDD